MTYNCEQLNDHACKTYLITVPDSNQAALIDPVLDHTQDYVKRLETDGLELAIVIDTHTHADHISAGAALKDITGCSYLMHANAPSKCAETKVGDGFTMELLDTIPVTVKETPGHTGDSISLIFPDRVFTGDALFLDGGGAGRDDLPGGDPEAHYNSLNMLRDLPEDLLVLPAHDYRDRKPSSLAQQKQSNPHLKYTDKTEFINYINDLKLGPAEWMADVLKANYACATDPGAAWIPADSPACEVKGTLDPNINAIEVDMISADEVKQMLAEGESPVLIDVREPAELSGDLGAIDGVINLPVGELAGRLDELEDSRDKMIVSVCRSGGRAATAAKILVKAGFANVKLMEGGMMAFRG